LVSLIKLLSDNKMHTHVLQLLLHFQSDDSRIEKEEAFIRDVESLALKHGISFDDDQSMTLKSDEYHIAPCDKCGHLTIERGDIKDGIENMLPDFWFYIRKGSVSAVSATCELCE